ncbi:MAG: hypothetical protein HY063_08335 [Bacteroidetes bacterium]|nr:hypothetical protein [Bacteroidota bacterium]
MSDIVREYQLKNLSKQYIRQGKNPVYFDFRKNTRQSLNGYAYRDKSIHYIHAYPGRVSPHIAFYLLSLKDFESHKGNVLDPFAGSGTILLESIINPFVRRSAVGVEINPLARLISKVKTTPLDNRKLNESLLLIDRIYHNTKPGSFITHNFINSRLWFSRSAIYQLSKLKHVLNKVDISQDYKDFFLLCFSKVIRKVSKADPNIPPPVFLKLYKYKRNVSQYKKLKKYLRYIEKPDVWQLFERIVSENSKLTILNFIDEIKHDDLKAKIIWDDARAIRYSTNGSVHIKSDRAKKMPNGSIGLVLTSPPYLTAQKYIRSTKLELLWLGYSNNELSVFEKATVGSEMFGESIAIDHFKIRSIDALVKYAHGKSARRGVMVSKYFENMKLVLIELFRVLKKGGYAIFIMGDNIVLGKQTKTYRLLTDLAESLGFNEVVTLKDRIRQRSMMSNRHGTGGLIKNEYIIILKK